MSSTSVARPSPGSSRLGAPSTPARQTSSPATPQPPQSQQTEQQDTPGTWRHPKMDEINRRKNATTFSAENIRSIYTNLLALTAFWIAPGILYHYTPSPVVGLLKSSEPYATYGSYLTCIVPVLNILIALLPLIRPADNMADIPLTAEQRRLLGLAPEELPLPKGAQYTTPPRFSRSSTPRSSAQRPASGSPLSARGQSPSSLDRSTFGQSNPFSVSPLMQKALGGASASRSSPLDGSVGHGSTGVASGKASVSLNSKWLYERGKGSPSGRSVFT